MGSSCVSPATKIWKTLKLCLAFLLLKTAFAATTPTMAQRGGSPSGVVPEIVRRQPNRSMDHYDRELERLKSAAMIDAGRRRILLSQIKEDFEGIQAIHNEMLEMVEARKTLKYDRLMDLGSEMKKRSQRLATNLALPSPANDKADVQAATPPSEAGLKESFFTLHDVLVSFVTNPIFKNLKLFDASAVSRASEDLKEIVVLSESIKKSAKALRQETVSRVQ